MTFKNFDNLEGFYTYELDSLLVKEEQVKTGSEIPRNLQIAIAMLGFEELICYETIVTPSFISPTLILNLEDLYSLNEDFEQNEWWQGIEDSSDHANAHWYSFWLEGVEVARMLIECETDTDAYIMIFEIAKSYRRLGLGRQIISIIEELYKHSSLTATAKDEDSGLFWQACGWRAKPGFGEMLTDEGEPAHEGVYWKESKKEIDSSIQ